VQNLIKKWFELLLNKLAFFCAKNNKYLESKAGWLYAIIPGLP